MSVERKRGLLKLEGMNPMEFVEQNDNPSVVWTPEQEAAAKAVLQVIKSYIKTTEDLVNGKYSNLRDKIPEYMSSPGNVLTAICTDGIVIRYEKKTDAKRKCAVTVFPQGIAEVAAILSQNLVHIESLDTPQPLNENFGVEFKLSLHSPSKGAESPRVLRRLLILREWSHEQIKQVFPRSSRTRCPYGARASQRVSIPMGGH